MPRGEHRYTCLSCGITATCGDCILSQCPNCERKDADLRKAGWRSVGEFGGEFIEPGVRTHSLLQAWEIYLKSQKAGNDGI